jgi:hypothetical protein
MNTSLVPNYKPTAQSRLPTAPTTLEKIPAPIS